MCEVQVCGSLDVDCVNAAMRAIALADEFLNHATSPTSARILSVCTSAMLFSWRSEHGLEKKVALCHVLYELRAAMCGLRVAM